MGIANLESLLFKAGSSELSYGYIESLLTSRISAGSTFNDDVDSTADLIRLLVLALQRAGNGWVVVVSRGIFQKIVSPLLRACSDTSNADSEILESLSLLIESFPVIVRPNLDLAVAELMRLLNLSTIPSVNLLSLVSAFSSVGDLRMSAIHLILTKTLGALASCQSGRATTLCFCILLSHIDFVTKDRQIQSTTMGLALHAFKRFQDNREVRSYYKELCQFRNGEQHYERESALPMEVSEPVVLTAEPVKSSVIEGGDLMIIEENDSPRSSCPSLDL